MEKTTLKTNWREALFSLLVAIFIVWANALLIFTLVQISPFLLLLAFLLSWISLEALSRKGHRSLITATLLSLALAAIFSTAFFITTGIYFFVFFIIFQPLFYLLLRDKINQHPASIPLILSLFYLPLLLPLLG